MGLEATPRRLARVGTRSRRACLKPTTEVKVRAEPPPRPAYPRMGQRPQIRPRSRDNGPASADMAQIPRQWASVRRYSPDPETMGQRPQIRPRSRDNGPASADTAQIPRQWASG